MNSVQEDTVLTLAAARQIENEVLHRVLGDSITIPGKYVPIIVTGGLLGVIAVCLAACYIINLFRPL